MAVKRDPAGSGQEKARHQIDEAGLAAAGGADQRDRFAGFNRERNIVECRDGLVDILQADVFKAKPPLSTLHGNGAVILLRFSIDQSKYAFSRSQPALYLFTDPGKAFNLRHQCTGRNDICHKPRHLHACAVLRAGGKVDHQRDGHRHDQMRERCGCRRSERVAHGVTTDTIGDVIEAFSFKRSAFENLDHFLAADRLLQHIVERAPGLLAVAADIADALAKYVDNPAQNRHSRKYDQR